MSKKTKKADVVLDDILYKQIQWTNNKDTNWKNIPKIPSGVIGSGFHRVKMIKKIVIGTYMMEIKKLGKR